MDHDRHRDLAPRHVASVPHADGTVTGWTWPATPWPATVQPTSREAIEVARYIESVRGEYGDRDPR